MKTSTARFSRILALVILVVSTVAEASNPGESIVVAVPSNMAYPDPHVISVQVDNHYEMHVFEGLMSLSEDYTPQLQLAESVDVSPDGRAYVFRLRSGVRFHDGGEMTSADVVRSFERYQRVSPNRALLSQVTEMTASDRRTFRVLFSTPQPLFLEQISSPRYFLAILPAADGNTSANANSGIGTGPYRMVRRVPDNYIKLARFDGYARDLRYDNPSGYGGRRTAHFASITFRVIPEGLSRVAAIQTGEVQLIDNVPVQSAARLETDTRVRIIGVLPFAKYVTILNASRPPTNNVLVRRAIEAAIDDVELMTVATEGYFQSSRSFLNPTNPYYSAPVDRFGPRRTRLADARRLLKEAGYKGEKITIMTTSDFPMMKNGMIVLTQQLRKAGMNAELRLVDWQSNVAHRTNGTGGWNITTTGYGSFAFEGPQAYQDVFAQMAHIPDDKVLEDGFKEFMTSTRFDKRLEAWRAIETRMADQAYILVNGTRGTMLAAAPRLRSLRPFYSIRLWDAHLESQ